MDSRKKLRIGLLSVHVSLALLLVFLLLSLDGYDSRYAPVIIAVLTLICMVLLAITVVFMNHVSKSSTYEDTDPLTGLPKYKSFQREVARILAKDPKGNYVIATSKIRFLRVFNATYGTTEGDSVIRHVGEFVRRRMGERTELVAAGYFSGDNIFTCWKGNSIDFENIYFELNDELRKLYPWFNFMPCVGFAHVDGGSKDVGVYCDNAIHALAQIADDLEQHFICFDDNMNRKFLAEHEITLSMYKALENGEFVPFVQPQYNYETGDVIGAEVLVRWIKADGSIVPPNEFIPVFEKNGFIYEMDKYIWEEACKLIRKWADKGYRIPSLSVNVSRRDIYHNSFVKTLQNLVFQYGVKPSQLHLEVTESAYSDDPKQLVSALTALRNLGFVIEMDDFGSGYSSLNALQGMPVDVIKLDSVFLRKGDWGNRTGRILASIVRMVHLIDLHVIVEGVETQTDAEFLKSIGCRRMQGYYFARPMAVSSFEDLLQTGKVLDLSAKPEDSMFQNVDFFDIETQSALLFNSFVGGAAIIEQGIDGKVSMLRMNDKFYEIVGMSRGRYSHRQYDVLAGLTPETARSFSAMLKNAEETGKEDSCMTCSVNRYGHSEPLWCYCKSRFLSRKADSKLFYLAIEDVSDKVMLQTNNRRLQSDIESREDLFRHAADQIDMYYWKYDLRTSVMYSCFRCQENLGLPPVIPNYPDPLVERNVLPSEQLEDYKNFLDRLRSGEDRISIDVNLTPERIPYRITYTIERDNELKPRCAYGTALPRRILA